MFDRAAIISNNKFSQRQLIEKDGSLKTPYSFGYISDSWLLAANVRYPFPGKIPLDVYADICFFNNKSTNGITGEITRTPTVVYDAGISLIILRDVLEIYFPLYMSSQYSNATFYKDLKYVAKISLMINIDQLNPFLYKRKLLNQSISQ
ncbi:MAG: hypothetical protein HYZ42_05355 [Bacteroidetes bacterium]|nr:hypothetical protein [Bacteroidota bacterium]